MLPALAAAVLAGVALTACSSPVQVGTAATVGGDQITSKQLDSEVREYKDALKQAKVSEAQLQSPIPKTVLTQLIFFHQFDQFAKKTGLTITEGDIDKLINDQGGIQKIGPEGLSRGIPPSQTRQWIRTTLIYQKALERFGANLTDQASVQAAQEKLFGELGNIPVKVSHRYGTWDLQQGQLVEEARFGKPAAGSADTASRPDPATGQ
ncbi:SurA N-terminal domain-containing protein [Sphaerisporangium fuscum]|uniref:SurA N-terminal domain-containing protein n=1 Tax=Sphaerisporangium fuscum TaxID=2835868 RepID=UPI001BDBB36C|nr:SurA N-terminal domain-containing protein [Sphaerisporangium fuscum]